MLKSSTPRNRPRRFQSTKARVGCEETAFTMRLSMEAHRLPRAPEGHRRAQNAGPRERAFFGHRDLGSMSSTHTLHNSLYGDQRRDQSRVCECMCGRHSSRRTDR